MAKPIIEKSIAINAPVKKAWSVFTDREVTRQMGGEYVSDWKVGSSFGWKGLNGKLLTTGKILQVEPEKLIKHELLDINDKSKLLSVITYTFSENGERTVLDAKEELNYEMTAEELKDASDGWDAALNAVKATAEKI
jgi:uncharacterized protein YndB with AHSA1/START domain